jgi:FixJ family two-component response regulator
VPLRDETGKIVKWYGTSADVEGLKRAEEELSKSHAELVMELVVSGLLNKQVCVELGINEGAVKVRRGQVMQKMRAGSLADLVRMSEKLGIPRATKL